MVKPKVPEPPRGPKQYMRTEDILRKVRKRITKGILHDNNSLSIHIRTAKKYNLPFL